jgi:FAD:protein FMN transferase
VSGPGSASLPALGTTATLWTTDAETLSEAAVELERELAQIDATCSRFRDDSELSLLNRGAGTEVTMSPLLTEAIGVALRVAETTGGLVDPTVGISLRLLGYDKTFAIVRSRDNDAIQVRYAPAGGWRRVEFDAEKRRVRLPVGTELDLGATAKALAADRAAHAAATLTGSGVLVSLGGDIAVAGPPPEGGWPILVADDHRARLDGAGPVVAITSGGLATSSTHIRRWRVGKAEFHHIVDPRSGRPVEKIWRTATVAAASCIDANTACTAAIVLGRDAPDWLDARRLPARLVEAGGSVVTVGAWPREGTT